MCDVKIDGIRTYYSSLIDRALKEGVLFEKDNEINLKFMYVNGERISWPSKKEMLDEFVKNEGTFELGCNYLNVRTAKYLESILNVYIKTRDTFPDLCKMIFDADSAELNLVFSAGRDNHAIYYFNLDSNSNGQIVHCPLNDDMARRITMGEDWIEVVAENTQYLSDIDSHHLFETVEKLFRSKENGEYKGTAKNEKQMAEIMYKLW